MATLSATTPVLILPLLWMTTGIRPPLMAWISAVVTVLGIVFDYNCLELRLITYSIYLLAKKIKVVILIFIKVMFRRSNSCFSVLI